jgi:mannan endo-1,4-beta-mannosidase
MRHQKSRQKRPLRFVVAGAAIVVLAAGTVAAVRHYKPAPAAGPLPVHLPHAPESYIGVYSPEAPDSYAGVTAFKTATGVTPDVAMYYSGWFEGFQTRFAAAAARQGAVPLVQINPDNIKLASIAAGKYDGFLTKYASEVRTYRHPVILSFGHEMNGNWYSWGYQHTSPAAFVAAWRHIVTIFRAIGASNVTWLWTVNIMDTQHGRIPAPGPWWPGSKYVTWVGIDGYYLKSPWTFAPMFGPTIAKVREFTRAPILIAETGAGPIAGQPAKIADLFAGIHTYGLLGLVWFNAHGRLQDWHLASRAAATAFQRGAQAYKLPRLRHLPPRSPEGVPRGGRGLAGQCREGGSCRWTLWRTVLLGRRRTAISAVYGQVSWGFSGRRSRRRRPGTGRP